MRWSTMSAASTTLPLVGAAAGRGASLARRTSRRIALAEALAGGGGAVDVFVLLWLVLPHPPIDADEGTLVAVNAAVLAVVLLVEFHLGNLVGRRFFDAATEWLREGRPASRAERSAVLRQPLVCAQINAACWAAATAIFTLLNLPAGAGLALHVGATIVMGGVTCTPRGSLLGGRARRTITAEALSAGPVARPRGPGVVARLTLAWASATGVPLAGLVLVGANALARPGDAAPEQTALSVVVLAAIAIGAGVLATWLVARSVADPLTGIRRALGRVQEGDFDARVTVDDGSEVGLLQSGFNAMVAGLAEREHLREVFGRHVGEDVARKALEGDGARLGGEVREVAVLFVDLIGSTSLAARRAPEDVVRLLNDFFAVVVDVVGRHGGWINKFEGDAALAVFGAPADHADPAAAVLRAARELRHRLHALPGVDAGIGVSAGPAVAGNVGAERRFEYTVIGTPVNEAARLCELAKRRDERLLASAAVLERARGREADGWEACDEVLLRGRRHPTRIARPVGASPLVQRRAALREPGRPPASAQPVRSSSPTP